LSVGLTTAAGLGLVAAIGLSPGGMYVVSVAATLVGVLALAVLRRFEHKDERWCAARSPCGHRVRALGCPRSSTPSPASGSSWRRPTTTGARKKTA